MFYSMLGEPLQASCQHHLLFGRGQSAHFPVRGGIDSFTDSAIWIRDVSKQIRSYCERMLQITYSAERTPEVHYRNSGGEFREPTPVQGVSTSFHRQFQRAWRHIVFLLPGT